MQRRYAPPPKVDFRPWKPDVCQEPGCDERHPSYSRDGMQGPWRCRAHDLMAKPRPDPAGPLPSPQQSRLL